MIIITGAAGFIGSCVAKDLKDRYDGRMVLVDKFERADRHRNLKSLESCERVERDVFFNWLPQQDHIEVIIHIGARTDTTEPDYSIFERLNVDFTQRIWKYCAANDVTMIYASSAATYGMGTLGYVDDHDIVSRLKPLNAYGISKNEFDKWALNQNAQPAHWYGLKFFNVYGPNEYHKGRMASVVYHAFNQIKKTGQMKLFKSHNDQFEDGEQLRDFIYVRDILSVIRFLIQQKPKNGLYNLGTGKARTFKDLVSVVFEALGREKHIEFIDTPADIRDNYQYYTEAEMTKLRKAGYSKPMTSIEEGVSDYVKNYLNPGNYY